MSRTGKLDVTAMMVPTFRRFHNPHHHQKSLNGKAFWDWLSNFSRNDCELNLARGGVISEVLFHAATAKRGTIFAGGFSCHPLLTYQGGASVTCSRDRGNLSSRARRTTQKNSFTRLSLPSSFLVSLAIKHKARRFTRHPSSSTP
jgi:hypothetical protein